MTNTVETKPRRRTVRTTGEVTGALMNTPLGDTSGPHIYVQESSSFLRLLEIERTKAERLAMDLQTDIDRLQQEIDLRVARRDDLNKIVARCNVALDDMGQR